MPVIKELMAFDFPMTKSTYSVIPFALMRQLVRAPFQSLVTGDEGSITNAMDVSLSKLWELVIDREAWRAIHRVTKSQTRLRD